MRTDQRAGVASGLPEARAGGLPALDWLAAARGLWASADVRWLTAILVVALVVRIAWVATVQPDPRDGRFDDSVWYYHTARHLAEGDGYVVPGDAFCKLTTQGGEIACDELPPTAQWAPGFPLLLSTLFFLPGDHVAAARTLNVLAVIPLLVGVYYLGRQLWNGRVGLLAAGVVALFPSHIFFSSLVITETVFAALAVGLLALTLAWMRDRESDVGRTFVIGLAVGVLAMVKPEASVFAVVVLGTLYAVHRNWRSTLAQAGVVALAMGVFFVPWTVRNAIQLDAPITGTTGVGQALLQAHNPLADGDPEYLVVAQLWLRFSDVPRPEREVRASNTGVREAIDYAFTHPGHELELIPKRLGALYGGDRGAVAWNQVQDGGGRRALSGTWADRWADIADAYYYTVLAAAVLGLPLWLRRATRWHALVFGPVLTYTAMFAVVFISEARYHLPLVPLFALWAAAAVVSVWETLARRRAQRAVSPA